MNLTLHSATLSAGKWGRLAWLPVLLLLGAIIAARVAGLSESYKAETLRLVLSFIFYTLVSLGTLFLIGRSFLALGSPGLLLLECGVVLWSLAGTVGDFVSHGDANINVTIFNIGILLAGLCHLVGAILTLSPQRVLRMKPVWLGAGFAAALGALWLVSQAALSDWLPVLFIPGHGGTPVRHAVLISAITMFVVSAGVLHANQRAAHLPFTSWYKLALVSLAVGLFGIMIQLSLGSVVNWLSRTAQWLGGVYLLIAAIASLRESHLPLFPVEKKSHPAYYRDAVAVVVVFAAAAIRLAFLSAMGTHSPFVVFFPAVIFAALYGGLRAGLLATAVSAVLVDYFWLEPVNQFGIGEPSDLLAIVIYLLSGGMISWISDSMLRARARATAAETQALLAEEREKTAEALREGEERLRFALETSHTGAWDLDLVDHSAYRSVEHDRVFGYAELLPQWTYEMFLEHVLPEDRAMVNAKFQHAVDNQSDWSFECRIQRTDGQIRWIWAAGRHVKDTIGSMRRMAGIVQDITEHKRMEEELRKSRDDLERRVQERTSELSKVVEMLRAENIQRKRLEDTLRESESQVRVFASQCLTAQETERKRVAGELHDSIASTLSAIKFQIENTVSEMKQGTAKPDSLEVLIVRVQEAIAETRRIMADLRPGVLDDLGILPAVNWFCREFQKVYEHIRVEREDELQESDIPDALKTVIFRISQEALNNIAKHSKATVVNLSLNKRDGGIELVVRDNGKGFDPEIVYMNRSRKGLGLTSMRERAELSGGTFAIESAVGEGTTIRARWPI